MDEEDKTSQSSHNYSVAPDQSQNSEPALYSTRREKVIKPLDPDLKVEQIPSPKPANKATSASKENSNKQTTRDLSKIYPENTRDQQRHDLAESLKTPATTTRKTRIASRVPALQIYLIVLGFISAFSLLLVIGVIHLLNIYNASKSTYSLSYILKTPEIFITAGLQAINIIISTYLLLSKNLKNVSEVTTLLIILECLALVDSSLLNFHDIKHISMGSITAMLVSALLVVWLFFVKSKVDQEATK